VMAASLVRSRAKTEPEVRLIERVIHAADRLTRMITELLDYTACRLGGRIELVREPADLGSLVGDTVRELVTARKTEVQTDLAPTTVHGWDATRIEQVVTNLVLNAILHGKAPVRVKLREENGSSILEVHDAGGALDADARQHLFAPTRKRLSTTREAGSLGLGLYVTEQIVQAFGGRIGVRSRPDEGTVFTVQLPHVEPAEGT
jgi:signal transduction histidine kinase